jgi:hypothetical protein
MTEQAILDQAENYARLIIDDLKRKNPHRSFTIYTEQILFVASRLAYWEKQYLRSFTTEKRSGENVADYKRIAYGVAMKWIVNQANLIDP